MSEQNRTIEIYNNKIEKYRKYSRKEELLYIHRNKIKTDYYFIRHIPHGFRNKKVLDIGFFYPFDAIYWAGIVKEFHAIDLSKTVVDFGYEIIKKELSDQLVQKVKFQIADATNIPYPDNYFDVVTSFSTLDHIPGKNERDKAFSEITRVTKRKGYVIITLPNRLNFSYYRKILKRHKERSGFFEICYSPKELKKSLIKNNLKPIIFSSSAGDKGGDNPFIARIYNNIVKRFGVRMGWLAQKI